MRCQTIQILMTKRKAGRAILLWSWIYDKYLHESTKYSKNIKLQKIQQKVEANPTTTVLPFMEKLRL